MNRAEIGKYLKTAGFGGALCCFIGLFSGTLYLQSNRPTSSDAAHGYIAKLKAFSSSVFITEQEASLLHYAAMTFFFFFFVGVVGHYFLGIKIRGS